MIFRISLFKTVLLISSQAFALSSENENEIENENENDLIGQAQGLLLL